MIQRYKHLEQALTSLQVFDLLSQDEPLLRFAFSKTKSASEALFVLHYKMTIYHWVDPTFPYMASTVSLRMQRANNNVRLSFSLPTLNPSTTYWLINQLGNYFTDSGIDDLRFSGGVVIAGVEYVYGQRLAGSCVLLPKHDRLLTTLVQDIRRFNFHAANSYSPDLFPHLK